MNGLAAVLTRCGCGSEYSSWACSQPSPGTCGGVAYQSSRSTVREDSLEDSLRARSTRSPRALSPASEYLRQCHSCKIHDRSGWYVVISKY